MDDLISRQEALDLLSKDLFGGNAERIIANMPSAQSEIIRCKDCKHKHIENMVWTCPFGLSGGEDFFCGYGAEPYKEKMDGGEQE